MSMGSTSIKGTCILTKVQNEVAEWAKQFGDNESQHPAYDGAKLFSIPPLLGMVEELGELAAPQAKRHQGRGYMDCAEYRAATEDAIADLLIFMCDFASREGISLAAALDKTWRVVQQRRQNSWADDKSREQDGVPTVESNPYQTVRYTGDPDLSQNGQGWAEPKEQTTEEVVVNSILPRKPLDTSYTRYCSMCHRARVHRHNTSSVCPDCFAKCNGVVPSA